MSDIDLFSNWNDAHVYAKQLRAGGHSDWRVPSISELQSLFGYLSSIPFVDMEQAYYWTSSTHERFQASAKVVDFKNGNVYFSDKGNCYYFRCVRGGNFDTLGELIVSNPDGWQDKINDNGDGTWIDNSTGLMWDRSCLL